MRLFLDDENRSPYTPAAGDTLCFEVDPDGTGNVLLSMDRDGMRVLFGDKEAWSDKRTIGGDVDIHTLAKFLAACLGLRIVHTMRISYSNSEKWIYTLGHP